VDKLIKDIFVNFASYESHAWWKNKMRSYMDGSWIMY